MSSMAGGKGMPARPAATGAGASPHIDIVRQASGGSKTGIRRTEIGGVYLFFAPPRNRADPEVRWWGGCNYVTCTVTYTCMY